MGHVDHGKTSLLDQLRHTNVTASEAGGITQHIGAYQIEFQGQPITFIDTPGHAAFSKMRAHGARITDIVILVVAADDGVKPQTIESIKHIKAANVPLIVAVNKMDVKGASPEMVKAQLVEHEINVEGYGGSVPVVEISAKTGMNLDKLLETIVLLAELEELKADETAPLQAVVIESVHDKRQGPVATVLVTQGTLSVNQEMIAANVTPAITGKIKRITTSRNQAVTSATPGTPVSILGLKEVPLVGTVFTTPESVDQIKETLEQLEQEHKTAISQATADSQKVQIILRADTLGSLEAIKQNLPDEVELIDSGVGEVTESDVLLASTTNSVVINFHNRLNKSVVKLAEVEDVRIKTYDIIYKLLEDFEEIVLKIMEPTIDEDEIGKATVKAVFNMKGVIIAGCVVNTGKIKLNATVHIKRDETIIRDATIVSLKQGKTDVPEVEAGNECGLALRPQVELQEGDQILAFQKAKK